MRVIAGEYKGNKIKSVPNQLTRPTGDKIKESLFQMIGPFFNGGSCLDLFAGSGALAIEAISRGMETAILVDIQPKAISIIYQNVNHLHIEEKVEVYRNDAFKALKAIKKRGIQFDVIFLDPPYHKISYNELLVSIISMNIVRDHGMIVCEHDPNTLLVNEFEDFIILKYEEYNNTTAITIYQKEVKSNG
ncbi:16S rRNA (guanine(966)-N(2))-methyltransferase [Gracilibacillus boraciitolerans JCM 21714]|uniref:16S rRNA (Guanine(966)-N(2))-methyltransferase n=1 Tax=Gracilibacillus boraciitolerans JCM 21714 TaxID=1298598 RepID=W4VEC6_9BACI|nr:16S rRNA (guanine(966)-N(2))-methyltransferase RsmD [Gracilibacillus boraciitolerans]GAE91760.1 16S rRNA (guanine(966)-N(2))-methyltransferase [Gracilibacillus boraciitolerans JCM 21714]